MILFETILILAQQRYFSSVNIYLQKKKKRQVSTTVPEQSLESFSFFFETNIEDVIFNTGVTTDAFKRKVITNVAKLLSRAGPPLGRRPCGILLIDFIININII